MVDMDREAITKFVYQRLADPGFRDCLSAGAPDDTRPIVVALRGDAVRGLIDQIVAVGGAANVVIPALNGIVVLVLQAEERRGRKRGEPQAPLLKDDCTVGLLFERLRIDILGNRETAYGFVVEGPDRRREQGRAEIVAVAG
jgi:hypothetical protein